MSGSVPCHTESIGPTLEKLIVEFKDGRQDWVIDTPDIYRIVEE